MPASGLEKGEMLAVGLSARGVPRLAVRNRAGGTVERV